MVKKNDKKTITVSRVFLAGAAAVLVTALAAVPEDVAAATDTDTLSVTATVGTTCTIVGGTLDFGAYDPFSATPDAATGTITITCTDGAAVWVGLDKGLNGGGTSRKLKLAAGTDLLNYELYSEATKTDVWGVGDPAVNTTDFGLGRTGTGAADALTVYGTITAGQTGADAGNYADTVTATVNF